VAVTDPAEVAFTLTDSDLRIEWYSGTGCGGQNRNKVKTSCRITHIPTGIVSTAQTRERTNSLRLAKDSIVARVEEHYLTAAAASSAKERKTQVGSGMRGDKIRTYRFQDDTVTDHLSGKKASVKKVISGNFDLLW